MSRLVPVSIPPAAPTIDALMATVSALKLAVDGMNSNTGVVTVGDLSSAVSALASGTGGSGKSALLTSAFRDLKHLTSADTKLIQAELEKSRSQAIAQTQRALEDLHTAIGANGTTLLQLTDRTGQNSAAILKEAATRTTNDSALAGELSSLTTTVNSNTAAITDEAVTRSNADSALSSEISTTSAVAGRQRVYVQPAAPPAPDQAPYDAVWVDTTNGNLFKTWDTTTNAWVAKDDIRISANVAAITGETTARTTADDALGTRIDNLTTTVNGNTTSITDEETARSTADSALGGRIDSLTTTVNGNTTSITDEETARTTADSALGTRIDDLTTTVNGNTASITSESGARSSADSALSGRIDTAQAQVDSGTATGRMQIVAVASPETGVAAEFSVDVRATTADTFAQSGLRLRAMSDGTSEMLVHVNKFIMSSGTSTDGSGDDYVPFSITTNGLETLAKINGSLIIVGSVTADRLNVTSLSSISADIGTVTTGLLQDTAGKMVIDLAGGTITGYA